MAKNTSSEKLVFGVHSQIDQKLYRIVTKRSDLGKIRVEKIKRQLAASAKISPDGFRLYLDGLELMDEWTGEQFGLYNDAQLILSRDELESSSSSISNLPPPSASPAPLDRSNAHFSAGSASTIASHISTEPTHSIASASLGVANHSTPHTPGTRVQSTYTSSSQASHQSGSLLGYVPPPLPALSSALPALPQPHPRTPRENISPPSNENSEVPPADPLPTEEGGGASESISSGQIAPGTGQRTPMDPGGAPTPTTLRSSSGHFSHTRRTTTAPLADSSPPSVHNPSHSTQPLSRPPSEIPPGNRPQSAPRPSSRGARDIDPSIRPASASRRRSSSAHRRHRRHHRHRHHPRRRSSQSRYRRSPSPPFDSPSVSPSRSRSLSPSFTPSDEPSSLDPLDAHNTHTHTHTHARPHSSHRRASFSSHRSRRTSRSASRHRERERAHSATRRGPSSPPPSSALPASAAAGGPIGQHANSMDLGHSGTSAHPEKGSPGHIQYSSEKSRMGHSTMMTRPVSPGAMLESLAGPSARPHHPTPPRRGLHLHPPHKSPPSLAMPHGGQPGIALLSGPPPATTSTTSTTTTTPSTTPSPTTQHQPTPPPTQQQPLSASSSLSSISPEPLTRRESISHTISHPTPSLHNQAPQEVDPTHPLGPASHNQHQQEQAMARPDSTESSQHRGNTLVGYALPSPLGESSLPSPQQEASGAHQSAGQGALGQPGVGTPGGAGAGGQNTPSGGRGASPAAPFGDVRAALIQLQSQHQQQLHDYQQQMQEWQQDLIRRCAEDKSKMAERFNEDRKALMRENTRLRRVIDPNQEAANKIIDLDRRCETLAAQCASYQEELQRAEAQLQRAEGQQANSGEHIARVRDEGQTALREAEERWKTERAQLEVRHQQQMEQAQRQWDEERKRFEQTVQRLQQESQQALTVLRADQSSVSQLLDQEKKRSAEEKQKLMNNWLEETEILTLIWREDKEKWVQATENLKRGYEEERSQREQRENETSRLLKDHQERAAYHEHVAQQRTQAIAALQEHLSQAQQSLAQERRAAAAHPHAMEELRLTIERLSGDGTNLSSLFVEATAEKAREQERVHELERDVERAYTLLRQANQERRSVHNALEDLKGNIRVIVRCRPPLSNEEINDELPVECRDGIVSVETLGGGRKPFEFYCVLGPSARQDDAFAEVQPLMQSAVDGYNVCIFAYGQTGSGKTYTILGDRTNPGVLPRAVSDLFRLLRDAETPQLGRKAIASPSSPSGAPPLDPLRATVSVTMLELYLETLHDLLIDPPGPGQQSPKLTLRQKPDGSPFVQGATRHNVTTPEQVLKLLELGTSRRHVAPTLLNAHSSRSHTIFMIHVCSRHPRTGVETQSSLTFVDLAGSERISKSRSQGERFKEAQAINKSLSGLGDVIASLCAKEGHVPYRNQRLTFLLQESLGGSAKTLLFANITPTATNVSETLSTLNFAARVRTVQNKAARNLSVRDKDGNPTHFATGAGVSHTLRPSSSHSSLSSQAHMNPGGRFRSRSVSRERPRRPASAHALRRGTTPDRGTGAGTSFYR